MIKFIVVFLQVILVTLITLSATTVIVGAVFLHTVTIPVCALSILALMISAGIGFDGIWTLECYLSDWHSSIGFESELSDEEMLRAMEENYQYEEENKCHMICGECAWGGSGPCMN